VFGLVGATLALTSPATAASKDCADDVVSDWYGDGRVDKVFPLPCYQQAIRSLPVDVLDYSNAKQDILRALAFARKGRQDPGPSGGNETASVDEPDEPGPSTGGSGTGKPPKPGNPDPVPTTPTHPGDAGTGSSAAGTVDTSGPSSLPIPLLVLGGLALLLLAAGGVGYLSRRAQARREGGPPGPA
jgi:hypothetical protein